MSGRTLASYASAPALCFGTLGAMVATAIGAPLVALLFGLVAALGAAALLMFAPGDYLPTLDEPTTEASSLPTRGIVAPMVGGSLLASGIYGAAVAACLGCPVLSLVAGIVATLATATLGIGVEP